MDVRLPAHLEVGALIRGVEAAGGFGTVLSKGERDAGTIMVVITEKGVDSRAYERMPQLDGTRRWTCSQRQDAEKKEVFQDFIERRRRQDPDLWIVELDVPNGERFIGLE